MTLPSQAIGDENIADRSPIPVNDPELATEAIFISGSRLERERTGIENVEQTLFRRKAKLAFALASRRAYSSITNLRRYPFHKLKIDGSYVAALGDDPVAEVIVDCALALGKSLGLTVVIEGIETEEQRARVADKAPDQFVGVRTFALAGERMLLPAESPSTGVANDLLENPSMVSLTDDAAVTAASQFTGRSRTS